MFAESLNRLVIWGYDMAENLISTLAIGNALARTSQGITRESFPLEVFPQKVQKLILHLVKHRSFKLEFVASCMITAAAAAIGNSRRIRSREGWEVAPMFYMILVGRPGIGKTPPLEFAFRPLCDIDREREKVYAEQYKEYQALKAQYEKSNSQGEPPVAPKLIRTLISDFTQEAMVKLHADNFRGLCVKYDEIIGFFRTADRYNTSSLITDMLSIFTNGQLINSRKEQTQSLSIEYHCVSLIGTTQATMLPELAKQNLIKNGFIDRFIFVKSEDNKIPLWSKTVPTKEDSYNPEAIWKEVIDRLMKLQPDTNGVSGECHSVIVKLSGAAAERFVDWHNEFAQLQNEIEDERLLNTRTAKWDYQVPRMALVMQLLSWACYESDGEMLSLEAMIAAIKLNTFYETCYSDLEPYLSQSALPTVKAEYLKALPDEFKTHEAISIGKKFGMSESTVKHDLPKLVKSGHIACVSKGNYKKNYN